jgi:hypothetical protein
MNCPSHLQNHVLDASSAFASEVSSSHYYFKLKCLCGSTRLRLAHSRQKTVQAKCMSCRNEFTVYDLAFYPAAVKLSGKEEFQELDNPENYDDVFVMFEYGDSEPDVDFDENDITWCQLYVRRKDGAIAKVFDDETC